MSVPTIIIELLEGKFEALFSNTEVKFLLVNRNRYDVEAENEEEDEQEFADENSKNPEDADDEKIFGPYTPTLETTRLSTAVGWITIPESRLNAPSEGALMCSPVPDEKFD